MRLTCTTDYDVLLYSYSQNETCLHNYGVRAMLLGAGYWGIGNQNGGYGHTHVL